MEFKLKYAGAHIAAVSVAAMLLLTGNPAKADHHNLPTITEIVLQSGSGFDRNGRDFDILREAVVTAGLADALADENADLTVFAPKDQSFIRLARDLGYTGHDEEGAFNAIFETLTALFGDQAIDVLTDVLLYHVSPGAKSLKQVRRSDVIETLLEGGTIVPFRSRLLDGDPDLKDPRLFRFNSNIKASNGVIHTLNRVLIPVDLPNNPDLETIAAIVSKSGGDFDRNWFDYDILLNAVIAADLVDTLNDESADFTVFAPRDIAFIRLARALGYRGFSESGAFNFIVAALTDLSGGGDPIPLLTDVLLYHVSPGTQVVKDVIQADSIDTALGATFTPNGVKLEDNAPALRDPRLSIFSSDINASNGIVHTINRVLIPLDIGG